ncbi:hypothetical protein EV174_005249, partial [Coemansia sp. RSA 2320]
MAYWIKLVLSGAIAAASAAELVFAVNTQPLSRAINVFTAGRLIQTAAYVTAIRLHYYEQTRARKPSGTLLLYWLATIAMQLVVLRTDRGTGYMSHKDSSAVWMARYIELFSVLALFCAELWPRKSVDYVLPEDGDESIVSSSRFGVRAPVEDANIFSQLTFSWLSPLLKLGRQKQLTEDDLWELPASCAPASVTEIFDTHWQHELMHREHRTPSLLRALWKTVGTPYALGGVFKLIQDLLLLTKPILLSQLIGFVASYATDAPQPMSFGYFYAGSMLVLQIIQSVVLHQYFYANNTTGLQIRSSLTAAIFKKALRLSNETRQEYTTGSIVTLNSVDIDPEQMKHKDKRATMIDEALTGVKVIKLYAWERSFLSKIQHVRESLELVTLNNSVGVMAAPFLVSFTTFFVYSVFDGVSHGPLTAQLVFVSLTMFNMLRFPLSMFPIILSSIVNASVAMDRIYKLLTSDELDPASVTRLESVHRSNRMPHLLDDAGDSNGKNIAVQVKDGTFRWSSKDMATLDNISA